MAARRARVLSDLEAGSPRQTLHRHLIKVTQRLLAAHGLAGLTTRGIAREARVSDGVLYNHFADKDELVLAALVEQVADLGTRYTIRCPKAGEQDLRAGLTAVVELSLEFLAEVLPLVGGLITRPDLMHRLLSAVHAGDQAPPPLWRAIEDYVAAEQREGRIAADLDPRTVTHVIFGAGQLPVVADLLGRQGTQPQDLGSPERARLDPLVDFLVRACRPDDTL